MSDFRSSYTLKSFIAKFLNTSCITIAIQVLSLKHYYGGHGLFAQMTTVIVINAGISIAVNVFYPGWLIKQAKICFYKKTDKFLTMSQKRIG